MGAVRPSSLIAASLCALALAACSDGTSPAPATVNDLASGSAQQATQFANDPMLTSLGVLAQRFPFPAPPLVAGPVPTPMFGKTFAWSTATASYLADAGLVGAPADGVRFRLYTVDPDSTTPLLPLDDIGYADLANRTAASGEAFDVQLYQGQVHLADYLVTTVDDVSSLTVRAVGTYFGADGSVALDLQQRVTAVTYAFTYDLKPQDGPHTHLVLTLTGSMITMTFGLDRGGTTLALNGNISQGGTDVVIRVNGAEVAHASGSPGAPVITAVGGHTLTPEEVDAFTVAFNTIVDMTVALDGFFAPAYRFY